MVRNTVVVTKLVTSCSKTRQILLSLEIYYVVYVRACHVSKSIGRFVIRALGELLVGDSPHI